MTTHHDDTHWFVSTRRTVLIVDVVESVRLIEEDQTGAVVRWLDIVRHAENLLAADGCGRMVKSLGDGMLLDLDTLPAALKIAFSLNRFVDLRNAKLDPAREVRVRMGMEVGDLIVDRHDVYGHHVNIAARLAALGGPGEIVVSAPVRDQIVQGVDADIEDLGECFLKHVRKPVRAYRLSPVGEGGRLRVPAVAQALLPTIAVIPFRTPDRDGSGPLGQILAEELIRSFGQSPHLNVISRLSTAAFARGDRGLDEVGEMLDASHVMTGTVAQDGEMLSLSLDLTEVRTRQVIWSDRLREKAGHVLLGNQEMIGRVAESVGKAVLNRELLRARTLPVRTLESYTLMLAAINAMYRMSVSEFNLAERMLAAAIERNPRHSVPLAWLGQWHVLKAQQGWTDDPAQEGQRASANTARALDLNPECEQALTLDGSVRTHLSRDLDGAEQRYTRALFYNPNNPLANLLKGALHAFRGEGAEAASFSERAQARSPLDPHQYMYDCLTAVAYFTAGEYRKSLQYAQRSIRANATHTSTIRILAIAHWSNGEEEAAREAVTKLIALDPGFTISRWKASNPAARYEKGREVADILRRSGVPE